jgi:hypothetical protein
MKGVLEARASDGISPTEPKPRLQSLTYAVALICDGTWASVYPLMNRREDKMPPKGPPNLNVTFLEVLYYGISLTVLPSWCLLVLPGYPGLSFL